MAVPRLYPWQASGRGHARPSGQGKSHAQCEAGDPGTVTLPEATHDDNVGDARKAVRAASTNQMRAFGRAPETDGDRVGSRAIRNSSQSLR